ncbi:MAG: hypothetical protein Q8K86_00655 [Candidatus Nanopelagicaceae bacterium]|nr:hypothetical protein [Candidatus Nanopelagicaceae bacterium]
MNKFKATITVATTIFLLAGPAVTVNAQTSESFRTAAGMSKTQVKVMTDALAVAYRQAQGAAKNSITGATKLSISSTSTADRRYTCSLGGYIHTTMTTRVIVTMNTGNSTTSGSGHQTISDWRCIKGWVVNGDPYYSHTISGSIFAGKVRISTHISGGWKAIGPNKAKQSCQTSGNSQYSTIGNSGVTTLHVRCVPGESYDVTTHF